MPAVKNISWPRNPIDRFILARLEKEGLAPSPAADRYTLVRRLYLDVIGLLHHAARTEGVTLRLAAALQALNYLDGASDVLTEAMKRAPDSLPLANAAQGLIDDLGGRGLVQRGVGTLEKQLVGGGDGAHGSNPFDVCEHTDGMSISP